MTLSLPRESRMELYTYAGQEQLTRLCRYTEDAEKNSILRKERPTRHGHYLFLTAYK